MSDGFLARWTRRKRAVRAADLAGRAADTPADLAARTVAEEEANADAAADGGSADSLAPAEPGTPETAAADRAETGDPLPELPDPATLTRESDLAPFLRAGVPTALRNAALRRMWSIDPAIRDFVSEAREYAYDWNSPGGVPGLGPLLPSDDVQAMLRRIVGGGAPEPAAPGANEIPEHAEAPETDGPDAAPEPGQVEAGQVEVEQVEMRPEPAILSEKTPTFAEAAPGLAEPEPEAVSPVTRAAPAPGPRLRRHGGARPG